MVSLVILFQRKIILLSFRDRFENFNKLTSFKIMLLLVILFRRKIVSLSLSLSIRKATFRLRNPVFCLSLSLPPIVLVIHWPASIPFRASISAFSRGSIAIQQADDGHRSASQLGCSIRVTRRVASSIATTRYEAWKIFSFLLRRLFLCIVLYHFFSKEKETTSFENSIEKKS